MAVDVKPDPRALGENPLIEGLERLPVPATTLVIFGVTGDLAHRKLLPALYNLAHEGALPERFNLVGVARREISDADFRADARASITTITSRSPYVCPSALATARAARSGRLHVGITTVTSGGMSTCYRVRGVRATGPKL